MSEAEELRLLRMGYDAQRHMLAKLDAQRDDLLAALKIARGCISEDRQILHDCHMTPSTGLVDDGLGLAGLREYDAVLSTIDSAIAKATGEVAK